MELRRGGFRVPRLRLQPGERELVRLRPGLGALLPRFLGGLGLLAWAALVAWGPLASALENPVAFSLTAAAPLAAAGSALYLPRRRKVRFSLCIGGAAAVLAAAIWQPAGLSLAESCGAALGLAGAVALVLTEVDRRLRTYSLTNLRVLHQGGLWIRAPWTLHYDAILDLDVRQSPLGRLFNHGTIDPVLEEPPLAPMAKPTKRRKATVPTMQKVELPQAKPRLWGVRPVRKVQRLLEAFIQDATATEYLRMEQQTQKRVGHAMQDLGRANLLR